MAEIIQFKLVNFSSSKDHCKVRCIRKMCLLTLNVMVVNIYLS